MKGKLPCLTFSAGLSIFLACCAAPLTSCGQVQTQVVTKATLATTFGTQIWEYWLGRFIDLIPPETSRLLIFMQCFGGNMMQPFNSKTNTAVASGTDQGQLGYRGGWFSDGYGDATAAALAPAPGLTALNVQIAGLLAADLAQSPTDGGGKPLSFFPLEPITETSQVQSRHILIYAGQPEANDNAIRERIKQNFANEANTFVHTAGGEGGDPQGWNYPGSFSGISAALHKIGSDIAASPDPSREQFILFVADHGDLHVITNTTTRPSVATNSTMTNLTVATFHSSNLCPTVLTYDANNIPGFSIFIDFFRSGVSNWVTMSPKMSPGTNSYHPFFTNGDWQMTIAYAGMPPESGTNLSTFIETYLENGNGIIGDESDEGVALLFPVPESDFTSKYWDTNVDIYVHNHTEGTPRARSYFVTQISQDTGTIAMRPPSGLTRRQTFSQSFFGASAGAPISDLDFVTWIDEFITQSVTRLFVLTEIGANIAALNMAGDPAVSNTAAASSGNDAHEDGYDDDAVNALAPASGYTAYEVHNAGIAGKDPLETPLDVGGLGLWDVSLEHIAATSNVKSRHILVYSGVPNAHDTQLLNTLRQNFTNELNTTVRAVGGRGGNGWDYGATPGGLRAALAAIRTEITNAPDPGQEQFILFALDHGGIRKTLNTSIAPPLSPSEPLVLPDVPTVSDLDLDSDVDAEDARQFSSFFSHNPGYSIFVPFTNITHGVADPYAPFFQPGQWTLGIWKTNTTYASPPLFIISNFVEMAYDLGDNVIGNQPGEGVRLFFPLNLNPFNPADRDLFFNNTLHLQVRNNSAVTCGVAEVCQDSGPVPKSLLDSDQDGMPDEWEIRYGFNPSDPADGGTNDSDHDRLNNSEEYVAGTDPLQSNSVFQIVQIRLASNGMLAVSWPSSSNRTYAVGVTTDLGTGITNFVLYTNNIPATPPTNTLLFSPSDMNRDGKFEHCDFISLSVGPSP